MREPNSRENVCYFVETWRGRNAWDMARLVPSWTRLDKQQERDVRELIRRVSGLQDEADPNFQLALNFAWSNFRFHRFLDVNSHKIEKTIEGIYEKFIIHSDLSKAASWKKLTEEFLNSSLPSIKEIKVCFQPTDEPDGRSWLEQHVVHQYWTARPSRIPHSLHLHSNLAAVWDQHLYSSDPLYVPDDRVSVTETQVIRETLWLLSGVKKLFIFQLIDGKVTVRNNIIVTHLTHSCLRSVLEQIAAYGQVVFRLQEFIDEVMGHSSESPLPGSGSIPKKSTEAPFRTYQAFMWALYKYFISFKKELTEIEKSIINNDTTITLAIVVDKLSPRLAQLKVLHKVFSTGVAEVPPDTRNVVRASHLLNTLYKAILEYDNVGEASEQTVSLLFSLWVETVRPYLQTVDEWIVHGHLWDGAREFIIQRNKNVPVNHRDFWYATYTLYSVSEKTENEEKMNDNASASSGSDQGPSSRQHTMVSFLKPVLKQIIMAGKSMQLLKNLRCAESTASQVAARDADRKSLYTLFLESVQSRLRRGEDSTPQVLTDQQATKENLIKMQSIAERHLELDDIHDPLLAINFARLYLEQSDFHEKFAGGDICVDRSSESVTCQTFELTLRSCLYPHIDKQYLACCGNLMQTLKKDYRLVEYLQAMRNFFLMEGGDTMYDFYTSIFDKIREKETWQNVSFLNVQLQEAVGQRYPEDSSRYPSQEHMDEAVCGTLLQKQIAFFHSELANTTEKSQLKEGLLSEQDAVAQFGSQKAPVGQQIHRMFLLRVKLMHFVNSLHNYIMTRILHSTGLEFQHQVEEAKDLDQLIKIHYRYLSTIHDRCLLREKV
uniref:gamma-tubulin complex component 5 n=1 Tax=Ictidomys tridecemlineatus TaxID=43179 RepID=UPI001A9EEDCC|nr:gamma-tubulin complex component 5 [Ictidomys tridecemlineatus]